MSVARCGPRAAMVPAGGPQEAAALARRLRAALPDCAVVPGADSVLVESPDAALDLGRVLAGLEREVLDEQHDVREVVLPVTWDGEDLPVVADLWGCSESTVVARLEALDLVSAFCGFAPGFAYLAGLPSDLAVPRRSTPRPRVPAGSLALADAWCGVYPTASPGGWLLVGRTDAVLWDVGAEPPALLAPGTRVRLVGASR